jgi:phospholipid/cholesterol/gamma-HCH transport system substrate-binding protein
MLERIKKLFTKEVRIGIAGIIALFVLFYGMNYLKGINIFKPTSYFYVSYKNINGLTISSPVYADGFKIGLVRDIVYDYNHPGNITVEVELDKGTRIPKGSWASLESEMLGGVQMNIMMADNLQSFAVGDTIPGREVKSVMSNVGDMVPEIQRMLPKLDSILTSLNHIAGDENIPATLKSVKQSATNLEKATASFNNLMQNDIPNLTGKLNTIGDNFVAVSTQLKGIDYQGLAARVDTTLQNVQLLTDKLNRKDNSLGLLLNDTGLYDNLNATSKNASALLEDLKANPKRYVHFSVFGRKK